MVYANDPREKSFWSHYLLNTLKINISVDFILSINGFIGIDNHKLKTRMTKLLNYSNGIKLNYEAIAILSQHYLFLKELIMDFTL